MPSEIARPTSDIVTSWLSSSYTFIDDIVTAPTIGGTADSNKANNADANELEEFGVDMSKIPTGAIVKMIAMACLARGVRTGGEPSGSTVPFNMQVKMGSFTSPLIPRNASESGWGWHYITRNGTWTRDDVVMHIGAGAIGKNIDLRIAVAYVVVYWIMPAQII